MGISAVLDGPRDVGLADAGFAFDIRPGINPRDWFFDGTYAWPTGDPTKPSIVTLKPAILDDAWGTTQADTGIYARDRLDHYTQTGAWEEYPRLHRKDWVFLAKQVASAVTSIQPVEPSAGIVVHLNPFGAQLKNGEVAQIYFGHTDEDKKYRLFVREDGYTVLTQGPLSAYPPAIPTWLADGYVVPNRWGSLIGKWTKLFILPHGRNRILISSSAGGGWVYEDKARSRADYVPSENTPHLLSVASYQPAITSAHTFPQLTERGPVTVYTPPKVALQVRALHFLPSGTITPFGPPVIGAPSYSNQRTPVIWAAASPLLGPSLVGITADRRDPSHLTVAHSPAYAMGNGLKGATPTVTFSRPDNATQDQTYSPILYRFEPKGTPAQSGKATPGSDLAADMIAFAHTHDREVTTGKVTFRYGRNHTDYRRKFNIPFSFQEDGHEYVRALCVAPEWEIDGEEQLLGFSLQDEWRTLETTLIQNLGRFDGMAIDDAVKAILVGCGWPADGRLWDIDPTPVSILNRKLFRLSNGDADDDPTNLSEVARSAAEWLRYIRDTYTSASQPPFQWVMGFRPFFNAGTALWEVRFCFKNPDAIDPTPVKSFWPDEAGAVDSGVDATTAYRAVHREWSDEAIEPECNDLWQLGMGDGYQLIKAHKEDAASIAPNTALDSRPSNWLGVRRQFVDLDSALNTQELVTQACAIKANRMFRARDRGTFGAEWEPTLRLWDYCRIYQYNDDGSLGHDDWLVTGISDVEHLQDTPIDPITGESIVNRPCVYHVERWLSSGTPTPPPPVTVPPPPSPTPPAPGVAFSLSAEGFFAAPDGTPVFPMGWWGFDSYTPASWDTATNDL